MSRFIPAPAGNALQQRAVLRAAAVHPRACGERCTLRPRWSLPTGSSPRLRGTPPQQVEREVQVRFIPAPAGNAAGISVGSGGASVHPRACGERGKVLETIGCIGGSSPRLRGTPFHPLLCFFKSRFIPAPAGNAIFYNFLRRRAPVHPRACGERSPAIVSQPDQGGSSPRLRGTLSGYVDQATSERFIPAPAGNA